MKNRKPNYQDLEKKIEELGLKLAQKADKPSNIDTIYNTVFNKSFDAIVMLDENNIISDCNSAYERLTGYSYHELIGMEVTKLIHPDYHNYLDTLTRKLESFGSISLERKNIHKTGTPYWIELNGNYVTINGKKQFLAIIRDITPRKRAEKKLRDSNKFYCNMLNSMFTMVAVLEPGGEIIFANKTALNKVDTKLENVLGDMFYNVFWWQYSNEVPLLIKNDIDQCARGEKITRTIKVNTKKKGLIWISFRLSPISDSNGKIEYIVAEGMDITKRRQAQAELRDHQNFLAHLADSVPGILYAFDSDGRFLHWNKNFERVTGCSAREMKSRKILDFFKEENYAIVQNGITEVFQNNQTTKEAEISSGTGRKIPYFLTGKKIEFQNKEYLVGMGIDLTERKRLENHIRQSEKMEAVGQLVGGVVHDFNNMLGVILGHAQLAQKKLPSKDQIIKNLKNIIKAADRSTALTRQLLAFSRKEIINPIPVRINPVIDSMLKMIARLIGEHIDPVFIPGKGLWKVKLDSSQIDQLVANLSINARDAMPNGGKLIIETQNITFDEAYCYRHMGFNPGQYVMLSLSDNGIGMDEETQSHIFEPFFTTKRRGKGTGMGLATTYGIIKQNNGFINVYSEPGHGTTFKLYLPRWIGEDEQPVLQKEKKEPSAIGTILLVEDDEMVRELTYDILKLKGHYVVAASSPEQALEYCRNKDQKFQLLLTDVIMPGMNGKELKKAVEIICPKIKTLFMSGYTTNIIAHQGVLDDAVNFISKPFDPDDLLRKVSELLEES